MEREKLNDLLRDIHEMTGSRVMLLTPERQVVTYPDNPLEFCRLLQTVQWQESPEKSLQQEISEYISQNLAEDLSVQAMCRRFAVSKSELYRILRRRAPGGIARYVRQLRFERACDLLRNTNMPLWRIATEVGYDNPDYFLRAFKKETGVSAGKYRRKIRETQCD